MEVYEQEKMSDHPAAEVRYDISSYNPYPSPTDGAIGSLGYPEYDWQQRVSTENESRHLYSFTENINPQYQTFLNYPSVPSSDIAANPTYIPGGDISYSSPLAHLAYSGSDTLYSSHSYNNISPTGSTGSNGKPKRKRVQTHSQRKAANIRERRRMFHLNEAFDELRKRLPAFNYEKRLSRIETLRLAITYISFMKDVSDGGDPKVVKLKKYKSTDNEGFDDLNENSIDNEL